MSAAVAWKERLRASLRDGLKARDSVRVSVLRELISAIERAEAVGVVPLSAASTSSVIAGAVAGLGAGEVARRVLTEAEVVEVVRAELAEREAAIAELSRLGRVGEVEALRVQCGVIAALLPAA